MPIYDIGYRHWTGEWTSHPYRWWVISRQGIRLLLHRKRFMLLMIVSSIPFIVRGVMIYASMALGQRLPALRIDPSFFKDFITQQQFFVFIIAIFAGAGQIANDMKANALQIYLSKPITRLDYVIGKIGILAFFLALPTLAPAMLLYLLALIFESDGAFFGAHYWVPGPILIYSLFVIFANALVVLALSSLSRSSRFAGISFAAVMLFSQIVYGITSQILRSSRYAWISFNNNLTQIADVLFRGNARYESPLWASILLLAALMCGSAWVIYRRVQAVEVVS